jgi:hypothetical protein
VPITHIRESLTTIQTAEGVPPSQQRLPSDITFRIQRGDMRSFVSAIQYGTNLNEWEEWLLRVGTAKVRSVFVWEEGLHRAPFSVLIRHVFIWMQANGLLASDNAAVQDFVNLCLLVQDAGIQTQLEVIPPAWEKILNSSFSCR